MLMSYNTELRKYTLVRLGGFDENSPINRELCTNGWGGGDVVGMIDGVKIRRIHFQLDRYSARYRSWDANSLSQITQQAIEAHRAKLEQEDRNAR